MIEFSNLLLRITAHSIIGIINNLFSVLGILFRCATKQQDIRYSFRMGFLEVLRTDGMLD